MAEEQDELSDLEMEAVVGSGKPPVKDNNIIDISCDGVEEERATW